MCLRARWRRLRTSLRKADSLGLDLAMGGGSGGRGRSVRGPPRRARRDPPRNASGVVSSASMRWLLPLVLLIGVALRVEHLDYGLDTHDLSRAILSHQQDEEGMVRAVLSGAGTGRYPWQSPSAGLLRGDPQPGIYMLWGSLGYYVFGAADA